jgi:hypothetical protein
MSAMRLKKITLLTLVCALPLTVFGEPGSTKPGPRAGGSGPNGGDKSHSRTDGERNRPGTEWFTERFKEELKEFCVANSPNRWKVIDSMTKSPAKEARTGAMAWQFRSLKLLKEQDAALYEIKVKEIRAQDEEFGILQNPQKLAPDALKLELRPKALEYVTLRLDERRARIEDLEKKLEAEKKAEVADRDRTPTLVDERVEMLINQGPSLFPTPGPHRGEGIRGDTSRPSRATTGNALPAEPTPGN